MKTIKIALILLGVALGFGCGSQQGTDLWEQRAADVIKSVYGYPREVHVSIANHGWHHPFGESDITFFTPESKVSDIRPSRETREAILNHAIRKGWLTLDFQEMANTGFKGKRISRFTINVTPAGEEMWQKQGERVVARFGTSRFKGITTMYAEADIGLREKYVVSHGAEIEVLDIWRGTGGQELADDRLTGELTTTLDPGDNGVWVRERSADDPN